MGRSCRVEGLRVAEYDVEECEEEEGRDEVEMGESVESSSRVKAEFARVILNIAVQYEKNKSSGVGGGVRSPPKRMVAAARQ